MFRLAELYFAHVLFHIAIVAFANAAFLVDDVEDGGYRFVVGDADGIVAAYDAAQFVGCFDGLLFYDFIVADDVEDDLWRNDRQPRYFVVGEELVGNLDDAFVSYLLGRIVDTEGDGCMKVEETEQISYMISLVCGYMVDDGAVFDGSDETFFLVHSRLLNDCFVILDVFEADAETIAEDGFSCIESVLRLLDIVGVGVVVDVIGNFVDTG